MRKTRQSTSAATSPPDVPDVERPAFSDTELAELVAKLPPKSKWPKLPAEHQRIIVDYLIGWLSRAVEALRAAATMYQLSPDTPGAEKQLIYWQNVCSAIKWLLHHVDKKQQYLAIAKLLDSRDEPTQ